MPDRVLIVDDDHVVRRMAREILEIAEYEVLEAADGMDGLDKAAQSRPAVILLDLMMPGIDGYETCRGLKDNPATRDIPVIFVTASGEPALNRLAYAAGAVACIPKPFRREALIATIAVALQQAQRRAGRGRASGAETAR